MTALVRNCIFHLIFFLLHWLPICSKKFAFYLILRINSSQLTIDKTWFSQCFIGLKSFDWNSLCEHKFIKSRKTFLNDMFLTWTIILFLYIWKRFNYRNRISTVNWNNYWWCKESALIDIPPHTIKSFKTVFY